MLQKTKLFLSYSLATAAIIALSVAFSSCSDDDDEPINSSSEISLVPITNITASGASSGGNFTETGSEDILDKGLVWSTEPEPDLEDNIKSVGGGADDFILTMDRCSPATKYFVRAYATTASETIYSNQLDFTTLEGIAICSPGTEVNTGITGPMAKDDEDYFWYPKQDYKIYKKKLNGTEEFVGGSGQFSMEDGSIGQPREFIWHPEGYMVLLEENRTNENQEIFALRKVTPNGDITTLATLPGRGYDVAIDADGEIYVSYFIDEESRVAKLNASGNLETVSAWNNLFAGFDFGPDNTLYYIGGENSKEIYTISDNQSSLLISLENFDLSGIRKISVTNNGYLYFHYVDLVGDAIGQLVNGQASLYTRNPGSPLGMLVEKDGSGVYTLQTTASTLENLFVPCE
jgi:hypothetical protein